MKVVFLVSSPFLSFVININLKKIVVIFKTPPQLPPRIASAQLIQLFDSIIENEFFKCFR